MSWIFKDYKNICSDSSSAHKILSLNSICGDRYTFKLDLYVGGNTDFQAPCAEKLHFVQCFGYPRQRFLYKRGNYYQSKPMVYN